VLCNEDYKNNQREEHLKKHIKPKKENNESVIINESTQLKLKRYNTQLNEKNVIRPIVEPE
jgi:hypothetical protein